MVARCSLLILLVLSAGLWTVTGCRTPSQQAQTTDDSTLTGPAPRADHEGGLLLRTGAIQLGPGVERNQWGWQGDGKGGF